MRQIRATMIHECNFNKEEFMNDDLREELRSEIEDFRTQTKRFLDKELNVKEFKGYSGGFGSYAQRGATSFMLRLRMNQGVMTKDKLKFICDTCKEHGVSRAHFTTCQTIQLHDLSGMHCLPWGRR